MPQTEQISGSARTGKHPHCCCGIEPDDLARGWDGAWRRSTAAQEAQARTRRRCSLCCSVGRTRQHTAGGQLPAWRWPLKQDDGFWLARWLRARGIETHVIHPTSIAVSREHRRAKTDRLDAELLKRAFLGWLRGERGHCSMAAIPPLEEEDARRPSREREKLVAERTRIGNRMKAALARLGIRGFKPTLRGAAERLETLRTRTMQPCR